MSSKVYEKELKKKKNVENYFGLGVLHGQSQEMKPEILFFRKFLEVQIFNLKLPENQYKIF